MPRGVLPSDGGCGSFGPAGLLTPRTSPGCSFLLFRFRQLSHPAPCLCCKARVALRANSVSTLSNPDRNGHARMHQELPYEMSTRCISACAAASHRPWRRMRRPQKRPRAACRRDGNLPSIPGGRKAIIDSFSKPLHPGRLEVWRRAADSGAASGTTRPTSSGGIRAAKRWSPCGGTGRSRAKSAGDRCRSVAVWRVRRSAAHGAARLFRHRA